ncbi:hypothetical protein PsYK624_065480 [Phanerochaete sordida]|uniref:Uncharacterized protein n=1 Tax=Phanerochaete sordida TaxID=48140 RepID=A0A9P3LCN6_9APHY|nr:hypothetical protein PsYK624_065480 [Phanerochaete sordida]
MPVGRNESAPAVPCADALRANADAPYNDYCAYAWTAHTIMNIPMHAQDAISAIFWAVRGRVHAAHKSSLDTTLFVSIAGSQSLSPGTLPRGTCVAPTMSTGTLSPNVAGLASQEHLSRG